MLWKDEYAIGVYEIDEQHKRLFTLVERLQRACDEGADREVIDMALRELIEYTKTHFGFEERMMLAHGYEDRDEHRKYHAKFVAGVLDAKRDWEAGDSEVLLRLTVFLTNWLRDHILVEDMAYVPTLAGQG
jgi:hemerythrin